MKNLIFNHEFLKNQYILLCNLNKTLKKIRIFNNYFKRIFNFYKNKKSFSITMKVKFLQIL